MTSREEIFRVYASYKRKLQQGNEPSTVENGIYLLAGGVEIDVEVPTSRAATENTLENTVRHLHLDLGHPGIQTIAVALHSRFHIPYLQDVVEEVYILTAMDLGSDRAYPLERRDGGMTHDRAATVPDNTPPKRPRGRRQRSVQRGYFSEARPRIRDARGASGDRPIERTVFSMRVVRMYEAVAVIAEIRDTDLLREFLETVVSELVELLLTLRACRHRVGDSNNGVGEAL
ncbi:hypothetical protein EDB83DRAFT_2325801 [Lactarius deliciosus]|nr:hypothetical protein EDB83DRAFT_2325801 [Lactarius deliciosus]